MIIDTLRMVSVTDSIDHASGHPVGTHFRVARLASGIVVLTGEQKASQLVQEEPGSFNYAEPSNLLQSRSEHVAVPLADDRLFIGGGFMDEGGRKPLRTTEILTPSSERGAFTVEPGPAFFVAKAKAAAVLLAVIPGLSHAADPRIVVVGGVGSADRRISILEVVRLHP